MKSYKVIDDASEKELNDLAKDGWILKFVNPILQAYRPERLLTQQIPAYIKRIGKIQYILEKDED